MQNAFTDDQIQFREVVDRFLTDKSPTTATRNIVENNLDHDADTWRQLSTEVGLTGTHIPEAYGGFGFGPVELGIAAEEMGRHIYTGPFFASAVMATYAVLCMADESAKADLLPGLAEGSTIGALVLDSLDSIDRIGTKISAQGDKLTGTAPLVVDGQAANQLITVASTGDELGLFAIAPDQSGVSISPVDSIDPTRKLARIQFDAAQASQIGQPSRAQLNTAWNHCCVMLAHEMVGGAQQLLDSTIEYTKIRYQFGRPIGSFQGLKHRCADLLMEVEWAKAATHHAARCLAAGEGETYLPNMVKALASDTYMTAAKEAIQMRGGIGFTWEEDTHFWYKRAKSSEVFLGTPAAHREQMMSLIEADLEEDVNHG